MTNKITISLLIAILVTTITLFGYYFGLLDKPEFFAYDTTARLLRSDNVPDKRIKVILVDEASVKAMADIAGRWPWPRAIWSDLLEFLSLGGARAVLFDILFDARTNDVDDGSLAEATWNSQNVYHSMMLKRETQDVDKKSTDLGKPLPADFGTRFGLHHVTGTMNIRPGSENNDYSLPIDPLHSLSKGIAVVEFTPDSDGVLRRTKPLREYQGKYFPVLGLAPFIDNDSSISIHPYSITINDRTIPVDRNGNYIINMYGIDRVEPYSAGGILASLQKIRQGEVENLKVSPEEFKDAIVFIGVSAVGGSDLKATPLAPSAPGVIFHVSLASNFLKNDFLKPPVRWLTACSILLGAFLATGVIFYSKRFLIRAVLPVLMLVMYAAYAILSFKGSRIVETVPFFFATVVSSFLAFGYQTFTEAAEKRRVSQLFTQYVSKDVLNEVLHHYKDYLRTSAGSKVEITVLFSDIRGFTTFSENTPPERVVEMLNTHFTRMADIILKHDGTLDKYIGDAIMAFWGAPVPTKDHPQKAVLAAMEMLDALEDVNTLLKERGFEMDLKIGIGINTGVATIGNIGSEKKLNYTVVGDTVNLASRLESLTKDYHSALIISEYTYERVKDTVECELLGNVKVKGREKPVTIYRPDKLI